MTNIDFLIDSDVWVGLFFTNDPHHKTSIKLIEDLGKSKKRFLVTNLIVSETATVLSHRKGQDLARKFLRYIEEAKVSTFYINENINLEVLNFFKEQNNKGTSFVDCSNVVIVNKLKISKILSFDKFYKKFGFGISI